MHPDDEDGFSLVELMVVVLIIGILVAIAVPVFNVATAHAREKTCFANQRTIDGAVESFRADTGNSFAGDVASGCALIPKYIKVQPACPSDSTKGCYTLDSEGIVGCPNPVVAENHGHY